MKKKETRKEEEIEKNVSAKIQPVLRRAAANADEVWAFGCRVGFTFWAWNGPTYNRPLSLLLTGQ